MRIPLFSSVNKVLPTSTCKEPHVSGDEILSKAAEVQRLDAKELTAVSGGPQITNNPPT